MISKYLHSLIWLIGIIIGVIPIFSEHSFGFSNSPLYTANSFLSLFMLYLVGLAATGSIIWGLSAKYISRSNLAPTTQHKWLLYLLVSQLIICTIGITHVITGYSYYIINISINLIFFYFYYQRPNSQETLFNSLRELGTWLNTKRKWNAIFYLLVFIILIAHNTLLIYNLDNIPFWHKLSTFFNRLCNQVAMVALLYLIIQTSLFAGPRWSHPLIWLISSVTPALIISDYYVHTTWNSSIMDIMNSFGLEGFKNFEEELKGGGIHLPALHIIITSIGGMLALGIIVWLCNIVSKRFLFQITPKLMIILTIAGITGATLEQSIGNSWKNSRNKVVESTEFDLQFSLFSNPTVAAQFLVEHQLTSEITQKETLTLKRGKPDIYIIFIESLRADAMTKDISPNLYRFSQTDAQPIAKSWSCSNGTHLSWFGTFTGRLPCHWKEDSILKEKQGWPALNTFHMFHNSGYDLKAYVATELAYRNMGLHFFGKPGDVFSLIRDNNENDPTYNKPIPEREVMLLDDLKKDISKRPQGGHLDILGLDSSHFYYTWHKDFKPPFLPYYEKQYYLPPNPSESELIQIKNKYHNSVAWCDLLVGEFLQHLKDTEKYDESIIIIMGDHGEELQDNGGWLHVSSLEEEQIRVPLCIKWPKSYGNAPIQHTANQLDILPSLYHYLTGNQHPHLPGKSLLVPHPEYPTQLSYTGMGGKTKDALVFNRKGYKAHFTWAEYWNWRPSDHLNLTRLYGPDGEIKLETNEQYLEKIKELFPDVEQRFFKKLEASKE